MNGYIAIGKSNNTNLVFCIKPGLTRWGNFENGTIFPSENCAKKALEDMQKIYSGCDSHITNIHITPI